MSKKSAVLDLNQTVIENTEYRRVIHTTPQQQLVVMHIRPEDKGIHAEKHRGTTQSILIHSGKGKAVIEGKSYPLKAGTLVTIGPDAEHEIFQEGPTPLKLSTIYSPPVHAYAAQKLIQESGGDLEAAAQQFAEMFLS
jgi:mannose-6-phosphate isomerase-like protein (cupin superfamily)